jgi:predicted AAA+ superfamily ATPase
MESMGYIKREAMVPLERALDRRKSVLLLGPRQTGKTTLLDHLKPDLRITLAQAASRQRYEKDPGTLRLEIEALSIKGARPPLVFIDEIQKVPALLDSVQDLIDRKAGQFVLSGSSARKLKRGTDTNLLPGRVVSIRLDPLTLSEDPGRSIEQRILDGDLPGIATMTSLENRETDLASYVTTYLEEEVRAEALVRQLASFSRFLELAASESGQIINLRGLSQDVGVAHTTIADYFQILLDCLIAERIEPYTRSTTRKKLTRSPKFLFFDLGVRRLAANEGRRPPKEKLGAWFEQWVGLALIRATRNKTAHHPLRFWRDPDGPEVDWLLDMNDRLTPIECKWTESPNLADVRHLSTFLNEYPQAVRGYLICRTPRRMRLGPRILAIPWQDIGEVIEQHR